MISIRSLLLAPIPKGLKQKRGGKTAVLLIDMQGYFVDELESAERTVLLAEQTRVIRYCAETDIPLIVLEFAECGKTITKLRKEIAKVPRVKSIAKTHDDGFTARELETHLDKLEVSDLLLMGINASYCVLATARSAVRRGYRVITADTLIANCKCETCASLDKDRAWYKKNGTFHECSFEPSALFCSTS